MQRRPRLREPRRSVGPRWENHGVTDTRFSTLFDSTVDLLSGVHIDDVGDIETLLMFLFDRPMGVAEGWDDDDAALDVIVHGNDRSHGFTHPFPHERDRVGPLMRGNGG